MGRRRRKKAKDTGTEAPQRDPGVPDTLHFAVVAAEVDLHGFTGDQAERRADGFLRGWALREPGAVVRVITGRGAGSDGAPVIQTRIRTGLDGVWADLVEEWAVDIGGGAFLVRLTSRG
jgi:hypothetical protein